MIRTMLKEVDRIRAYIPSRHMRCSNRLKTGQKRAQADKDRFTVDARHSVEESRYSVFLKSLLTSTCSFGIIAEQ